MRGYKLLHSHGNAGPNYRKSYIQFGNYTTKRKAYKSAREHGLESCRVVPKSRVVKTKHPRLYYIRK